MLSQFMKANQILRKERPVDDSCTCCEAFRQGNLLEISIPSFRCRHDAKGNCIMCNYGIGTAITSYEQAESQFDDYISAMGHNLKTLILCTNGSFLDDKNIPPDTQRFFLLKAQSSCASTIIIETHLDTLSPDKLQLIRNYIPSKTVILEIGLESANPFIQKHCYLKEISTETLTHIMKSAKKMGFLFQLNVILGAPFLPSREQIADAEYTIRWGLSHDALIALFPMNIKPYTLLQYAYLHNLYRPISHWAMPLLLARFSSEELERIDLAWYGNRQIQYQKKRMATIFPRDCSSCHHVLQDFYNSYMLSDNGAIRYMLVNQVLSNGTKSCSCMKKELKALSSTLVFQEKHVLQLHYSLFSALHQEHFI